MRIHLRTVQRIIFAVRVRDGSMRIHAKRILPARSTAVQKPSCQRSHEVICTDKRYNAKKNERKRQTRTNVREVRARVFLLVTFELTSIRYHWYVIPLEYSIPVVPDRLLAESNGVTLQ